MSGLNYSFVRLKNEYCSITFGEMAEWSIAAVSNTVKPIGFEGSNPSFSARIYVNKDKPGESGLVHPIFLYINRD